MDVVCENLLIIKQERRRTKYTVVDTINLRPLNRDEIQFTIQVHK